jgi:hypothetical protein
LDLRFRDTVGTPKIEWDRVAPGVAQWSLDLLKNGVDLRLIELAIHGG